MPLHSSKEFNEEYWDQVLPIIKESVKGSLPSVSEIGRDSSDPFKVLISTIISLRTKDKVTFESSLRLFEKADSPEAMSQLETDKIAELIYPAGFYKTKAENIKKICRIILEGNGEVPRSKESLLALPGVGLKTANLTLSLGWGIPAICVDIHVHRISNRMGWVETGKPDDTEKELCRILPLKYWIPINELLVLFGQQICTPLSPYCSNCPLKNLCPQLNVEKSR
ncbi:MAG: endonuclease III [Spirochaetales bacterium]|nr:endonuclease III [Spirochaetales bacterium]